MSHTIVCLELWVANRIILVSIRLHWAVCRDGIGKYQPRWINRTSYFNLSQTNSESTRDAPWGQYSGYWPATDVIALIQTALPTFFWRRWCLRYNLCSVAVLRRSTWPWSTCAGWVSTSMTGLRGLENQSSDRRPRMTSMLVEFQSLQRKLSSRAPLWWHDSSIHRNEKIKMKNERIKQVLEKAF